jgi:hypothetical protein
VRAGRESGGERKELMERWGTESQEGRGRQGDQYLRKEAMGSKWDE